MSLQAKFVQPGRTIDYTPTEDTDAGTVVVVDQMVGIVPAFIPANKLGALSLEGVWDVKKTTGALTAGEAIFWDEDANPVEGDAGTGGADDDDDTGNNLFMGWAVEDAASGDAYVRVYRCNVRDLTVNINGSLTNAIADPGNAGAIPVNQHSGHVALVTAGPETRTLAAPAEVGQELLIYMKTDGGDCVLTIATTINETGDNTVTFDNTGESLRLVAVEEGSNKRWRLAAADGAALSTV